MYLIVSGQCVPSRYSPNKSSCARLRHVFSRGIAIKMFCINCGKPVSPERESCDSCGSVVTRPKSNQHHTVIDATNTASFFGVNSTIEAGRILGNRYEIIAPIGSGGMGTIYSARRINIGDLVAVKVLRPDVITDSQSRERFQREAQAAARLHHPNAVVIHDFGQEPDGVTYIVMELLEGRSLRDVLQERKIINSELIAPLLKQACAAIETAHRQGIIHRDLKPDNFILQETPDGAMHVKLLDFGIAKLLDRTEEKSLSLTQTGMVIGTPNYMSPEQCQGEELDARSDIYSLGVVLYEMLTGSQPFSATNPTGIAVKHVTEKPRSLREQNPSISAAVEKVVLKALEKNSRDRQQSALQLAQEFEDAVTSNKSAIPLPASYETSELTFNEELSSTSKAPIYATITTLILLSGIALWWIFWRQPELASTRNPKTSNPKTSSTNVQPVTLPEGMIFIAGGEFTMGRNSGDDLDSPAHQVTLKPFLIDRTEVTNLAYQKFIEAKNYPAPPDWKGKTFPAGQDQFPVTDVTWSDANAFAVWHKKRLPTEEEWEFAARGNDQRTYSWGNEFAIGKANVKSNSNPTQKNKIPVGSYKDAASPFGAVDMIGNVWEWTASSLKPYPNGRAIESKGYKNLKVIRGGAWMSESAQATTTYRRGWPASRTDWNETPPDYSGTGFRCAQDVQ